MNIFGQHSEEDIAKGIRKGDNRAMRHFYAQYGGLLAAACSRYVNNDDDVKDLMQDAMVNGIKADTSASQFIRAKNILAKQIENYKRNKNHN